MDIEESIQETLGDLLNRLQVDFKQIETSKDEKGLLNINISSDNPSLLIGPRGEHIHAIQHILKVLLWKKSGREDFFISLDIDNYRKRQEENSINLALRKAENARKSGRTQYLPPMSAYLRRKVHLHFMGSGFDDLETISEGEDERRHIVIKLKS